MKDLIDQARQTAGLSIQALADLAGTSRPTLSAYIHGHKSPRSDTLERILAATGHELALQPHPRFDPIAGRNGRTYWVPDTLWRLPIAETAGAVVLPIHLQWSGPERTFDLSIRSDRARVYEIVLREGTPDDLTRYIDGAFLKDIWDELVLPTTLRSAWQTALDRTTGGSNTASEVA
ncbi:MAG TPA: XRE family transcriptional regulator [Actinobacteria bacterium]|nr:XRE family transcriptional regulator [Actinomycetota bacterium]